MMKSVVVAAAAGLVAAGLVCGSGCGASRETRAGDFRAESVAPADFSLSLAIVGTGPKAAATNLQSAWYVLDPDGSLRVAVGDRGPASRVPPIVRQLTRDQVDAVWRHIDGLGLSTPGAFGAGGAMPRTQTEPAAELSIAAEGRRSTRTCDLSDAESACAGAAAAVAAHLRDLAWMTAP